jgi:sugar phosphate permease
MTTLPELYLSYMVVRGVGPVAMSGAVVQTTVVNWFVRMRGRAAGITALSWQLFVSSFALVTSGLMQAYGWRSVFSVLGVAAAVGALPMALLLRRRPEDVGLLPDGDAAPVATRGAPSSPQAPGFTLREALRTRALWFMAAAQFCGSLAVQSASFHWAPRYAEVGIDVIMVASMISAYGLASALSTGVWGFLAERFPERSLAIITQCCGFCLVLVMMVGAHLVVAFAAVILFGLTSRGENSMFGLVLARFYGRRSYGKIAGIVHPCGTVGASLAPLLGGVVADVTGSYAPLYGVLACVYLLSIGCLLLARQPARPSARPNAC